MKLLFHPISWRRSGIRLAIALALGLITTIIIAWASAWFLCRGISKSKGHQAILQTTIQNRRLTGSVFSVTAPGANLVTFYVRPGISLNETIPQAASWQISVLRRIAAETTFPENVTIPGLRQYHPSKEFQVIAAGWPWVCLWADMSIDLPAPGSQTIPYVHHGALVLWQDPTATIPAPPRNAQAIQPLIPTVLPCYPRWIGLVANTATFTIPWWLVLAAVPAMRRRLRRRAGLCGWCGYDLQATPATAPCPECGRR